MPCEGSTDAPSRPPARVAGRSEAESLDGVEASPKMFDVMACRLTAANSRNLSASMSECHGDGGPTGGLQLRGRNRGRGTTVGRTANGCVRADGYRLRYLYERHSR